MWAEWLRNEVLEARQTRVFAVAGYCGIPATAQSLSINVTVTQPGATGNVRLFPAGQPMPIISSINDAAGQIRANNAIVSLNASGEIAAFVGGQPTGTTVHLIIDVNGYFEGGPLFITAMPDHGLVGAVCRFMLGALGDASGRSHVDGGCPLPDGPPLAIRSVGDRVDGQGDDRRLEETEARPPANASRPPTDCAIVDTCFS